jgi:hypothetical protein
MKALDGGPRPIILRLRARPKGRQGLRGCYETSLHDSGFIGAGEAARLLPTRSQRLSWRFGNISGLLGEQIVHRWMHWKEEDFQEPTK